MAENIQQVNNQNTQPKTPIALESESAILGIIINDNSLLDYVLGYDIAADDFGNAKHKQIWESIIRLHNKSEAIDKQTIVDDMTGIVKSDSDAIKKYIDELAKYTNSTNIDSYINKLKDASIRRSIMTSAKNSFNNAQDMSKSVKDVAQSAEHSALAITDKIGNGKTLIAGQSNKMSDYIKDYFKDDLLKFRDNNTKTGFEYLDRLLDNALYPGIYTIGAISSLGKTTLMSQIADQIAVTGTPVLYFSIEQSKFELLCKSLSRQVFLQTRGMQITSLKIRKFWDPDMTGVNAPDELGVEGPSYINALNGVYKWYDENISDNMYVFGNNFNCTLDSVKGNIKRFCSINQRRPVVFIDYLQIIQMDPNFKGSDKQKIDICMNELEKLAKELQITIFMISALNRASYSTPITYESFRESSSIEYSSDVIFALQLNVTNQLKESDDKAVKDSIIQEAKTAIPREIELKILKNRYGRSGQSTYFRYYPQVDFFANEEKLELKERKEIK